MTEQVTLRSLDDLTLEGLVDGPAAPRGVVVMCHPHPRAGGTMTAPLLQSLVDALVADELAVVRFNFRGIGASEGDSGDGIAEVADARGALAYARERFPGLRIALLGWSFGAGVAVRTALADQDVVGVVAITPPVVDKAGYSAALPDIRDLEIPVTVIAGANDKTTDPVQQEAWSAANGATFVAVNGANHFFWAKYDDLTEVVREALRRDFGDAV